MDPFQADRAMLTAAQNQIECFLKGDLLPGKEVCFGGGRKTNLDITDEKGLTLHIRVWVDKKKPSSW